MKKILLFLALSLGVLCFVACGGAKKEPEVVKFIIDKINSDIDAIKNTPAKKRSLDVTSLRIREVELAKNIKIEVTDVISSKEYIDMYVKELEERNKRLKEQGGILVKLIF